MKQQGKRLVIVRTHRSSHYTTLKLTAIEDPCLSYKAKGLHTYLISRPPEWNIYYHDLLARATDGKDSITSGIKEIKKYGYLRIELLREGGRIVGSVWHVFEEPQTENAEQPHPENLDAGKPYPENPQQSIYTSKNNYQDTTTVRGVVEDAKEKQIARMTGEEVQPAADQEEELKGIVKGTPFQRVDYHRWLKRPDLVDQIDKLVQTYAQDFTRVKRPQALVMNVMRHGAIAPDGYVPYSERQAQAKAAAAKAAAEKARQKSDRALQEAMIRKFQELNEQERDALLIEASATLGHLLGTSKGWVVARALALLREREEYTD